MQTQLERDLISVRDRIVDPENWTQGGCGYRVAGPDGRRAECWSVATMVAVGLAAPERVGRYQAVMRALAATFSDDELVLAERDSRVRFELAGPLKPQSLVIGFNDTRTPDAHGHAEVIAKLDRAIGTEQMRQRPPKPRIRYDATEAVDELRRKANALAEVVA